MKRLFRIFASAIIFLSLSVPLMTIAVDGKTGINLQVTGVSVCDNDGTCDSGENLTNCPLDCPAGQEGGALFIPDATSPLIYNLFISEININSAVISWETNEFSLCQIYLGRDEEYGLETIIETALYKIHSKSLINLSSATDYHFKISCRDAANNWSEIADQKFTTLTPPDTVPPSNIIGFEASAEDSKINLFWRNPKDADFKGVKILRSESFFPQDAESGILVYNGAGESFVDTGLKNGVKYYYTAFSYDKAGNYSSGAAVSAIPQKPGEKPPIIVPPIQPPATTAPPEIEKITLNDFDFIQKGAKLLPINGEINMELNEPLTVKIDYEKVPEVLKTIMVTLKKPAKVSGENDKFFSFILKIDKEKTAYLATLVPPESGAYPLTVSVMDYKNQALKQIDGQLIVPGVEEQKETSSRNKYIYLYILLLIIILLGAAMLIRKRMISKI